MLRFGLSAVVMAALFSGTAAAGGIAPSAEEIRPILIGSMLPDAPLRTADGDPSTLRAALSGQAGVLIVYRGGWCPVCTRQFASLRSVVEPIRELGLGLFAMSVDDPERLIAGRDPETPFTLLSDSELQASTALGLAFRVTDDAVERLEGFGLDLEGNAVSIERVLPVPAVFVFDAEGVITFSYANPNYAVRCDPGVILAAATAAAAGS